RIAAEYLPRQDPPTLRALADRLESLPESGTLAESAQKEKHYVRHVERPRFVNKSWLEASALLGPGLTKTERHALVAAAGRQEDGLVELIDAAASLYDELGAILKLPVNQFHPALAAFEKQHRPANAFVGELVRVAELVFYGATQADVLVAMLRT